MVVRKRVVVLGIPNAAASICTTTRGLAEVAAGASLVEADLTKRADVDVGPSKSRELSPGGHFERS